MSLELVKTESVRVGFDEQPIFTVDVGCDQILYRQYPATTTSDSNVNINITMDRSYAVATKMFIRYKYRVTINGTPAPGSRLVLPGLCAPRMAPLASVASTFEVSLNNQSFTQKLSWYIDALLRYNNSLSELGKDLSTYPSMPDYYQQYSDFLKYGSALNSLAQIGEAGAALEPRGGFAGFKVINGNGIDENFAVIEVESYEPIFLSPLNWGHDNSKSFINLTSIVVNITFDGKLDRLISLNEASTGAIITSVTGSFTASGFSPVLELVTLTPKQGTIINATQRYAFSDIQAFSQAAATLAPGESSTLQFNNITLSGIPRLMYLFLRRRDSDRNYKTTDTYASIDRLSLLFGNDSGIFAQCSPQQLYLISVQNGYMGSWSDFSRYSGSVMAIDCSNDIPTKGVVGQLENLQMQIEVTYRNIQDISGGDTINFTAYLVVVYDGLVTITEDATVLKERNILNPAMIANLQTKQKIPYQHVKTFAVSGGGSFGSKIKHIASSGVNLAKKAAKAYQNLPPGIKGLVSDVGRAGMDMIPGMATVSSAVKGAEDVYRVLKGKGYTEDQIYTILKGSGYKGGKKLTKAQLKKLAH